MIETKIEIFRTDVQEPDQARWIVAMLRNHFPETRINFDLHDCDKVLRVEGQDFNPPKIQNLVRENGFECQLLE